MRSESQSQRTSRLRAAGGHEDRAVGLDHEAAAVDVQLGAGFADDADAAALAHDAQPSHRAQPKRVRDQPGCDHCHSRARAASLDCARSRGAAPLASARRTAAGSPCGSRSAISAGSTTMTASNSRPLASAAGHDHQRMIRRHLAGLGEHDAAVFERGPQARYVCVVGDDRDRRHLLRERPAHVRATASTSSSDAKRWSPAGRRSSRTERDGATSAAANGSNRLARSRIAPGSR